MKRILAFCISLGALLLAGAIAEASPVGPTGWYVGAGALYDGARYSGGVPSLAPNALYGVDVLAGYQLFQGVAVEGGLTGRFSNVAGASADELGFEASGVVHVPLTNAVDIDGLAGLTYMSTRVSLNELEGVDAFKHFGWGWRVAAGPEFTMLPQLGWRTLVGYEQSGLGKFAGDGDVTLETALIWHV